MYINTLTKKYLTQHVSGYVGRETGTKTTNSLLRLDLGENLLGYNPNVYRALRRLSKADLNFYADPTGINIKQVIANVYDLAPTNITVANSSNEIIDYLPKMILEPKDKVLIIVPTFFRYIESSLSVGGSIIYISLKEEDGYKCTDKVIAKIIECANRINIKLIWLCNPNNPTGLVLDIQHIEKIVKKTNAFVVLDEAFYEFYDLTNKDSGVRLIQKYQNLIVLRTLSKAYGLAGLRLGHALAHEKVIEKIELYRNTLLMTSSVIQKLASTALRDQQWLKSTVSETKQLRENLEKDLSNILNLQLVKGSEANIYLLRHDHKDLYEELNKRGIVTADFRQSKGLERKRYVRITVGNKQENAKLLRALKNI